MSSKLHNLSGRIFGFRSSFHSKASPGERDYATHYLVSEFELQKSMHLVSWTKLNGKNIRTCKAVSSPSRAQVILVEAGLAEFGSYMRHLCGNLAYLAPHFCFIPIIF